MIARYGSKHHGMSQSLVLLAFFATLGCQPAKRQVAPPAPDAGAFSKQGPASTPHPATSPHPDQAVELGPLRAGSAREVLAKLQTAHYDPAALGLQQLRYQVSYAWAKHDVQARAEGRWSRDKGPEVMLLEVTRKGKVQKQPRPDQVSQEIWRSIEQGITSLLQGLGRGFLSERLEQWAAMEGPERKVQLKDDRLQLELGGEEGHYTVMIGPGYQVLWAAHSSSEGITRRMTYSYRTEQGRHLVSRAVLSSELPQGSAPSDEVRDIVASSQGMIFSLTYDKQGRFWLPTRLEKEMPATQDRVTLALKVLEARP